MPDCRDFLLNCQRWFTADSSGNRSITILHAANSPKPGAPYIISLFFSRNMKFSARL